MWQQDTHEKITFDVDSNSLSSDQNTAGLGPRRKKKGRNGKKKPRRTPCRIVEFADEDWESVADPALSMLSIHCSSRARACSSSFRRETWSQGRGGVRLIYVNKMIDIDTHILPLFRSQHRDNSRKIDCETAFGSSQCPQGRTQQMLAYQIHAQVVAGRSKAKR
jgi:hypothetical protein